MARTKRYKLKHLIRATGHPKTTLLRWEAEGKIPVARRDENGWRYYLKTDFEAIVRFSESFRSHARAHARAGLEEASEVSSFMDRVSAIRDETAPMLHDQHEKFRETKRLPEYAKRAPLLSPPNAVVAILVSSVIFFSTVVPVADFVASRGVEDVAPLASSLGDFWALPVRVLNGLPALFDTDRFGFADLEFGAERFAGFPLSKIFELFAAEKSQETFSIVPSRSSFQETAAAQTGMQQATSNVALPAPVSSSAGDVVFRDLAAPPVRGATAPATFLSSDFDQRLNSAFTEIAALRVSGEATAARANSSIQIVTISQKVDELNSIDIDEGAMIRSGGLTVNAGNIEVTGDITASATITGGSLTLSDTTATSTFSGNFTANGNITLGDNASDTLTVNASSTFANNAGVLGSFFIGDSAADILTVNAGTIAFATSATSTIPNSIVNAWSVATSTSVTPLFSIDTTGGGRIGIGTTSPQGRFALTGLGAGTGRLFTAASASSEVLTLLDNGRLGLGTTTPMSILSVSASTTAGAFVVQQATSTNAGDLVTLYSGTGTTSPHTSIRGFSPYIVGSIQDSTNLNGAFDVHVSGRYAYVTSALSDSLSIFDVHDPAHPVRISTFTDSTLMDRPLGLYVAGRYAYVGAVDADRLVIIDVSDPARPYMVSSITDSRLDGAYALYVSGRYAYVPANVANALTIVDVSDPTRPRIVGSVSDATLMAGPRQVHVAGRYAYVSATDSDRMVVVDVSNPAQPFIVGSGADSLGTSGLHSVYVSGKYVYTVSTGASSLAIFDVSNPQSPIMTSQLTSSTFLNQAHELYVSGRFAYIVSIVGNSLTVVDIASSTNPRIVGFVSDANLLAAVRGIFVAGRYAYIAANQGDSFVIIDVGGVDTPTIATGDIQTGSLDAWENVEVGQNLLVRGGAEIGDGGLLVGGPSAVWTFATTSLSSIPAFSVFQADSNNASVVDVLTIGHLASSSAANNIGTGLLFMTESGSGDATSTGEIASVLTSVTSTTSVLTFSTRNGGTSLTEYMRLDHLGRLGVGSTSPSATLSVQGDALISGNLTSVASITATGTLTLSGLPINSILTTNASGVLTASSTPTFGNFIATSTIATSTISTGGFAVGTSQFVIQQNSGNIGIGTTSPQVALDIQGNNSGSLDLVRLVDVNTAAGALVFLSFQHQGTDGVISTAGAIVVGKDQQWTSNGATRDGYLAFQTRSNNVGAERMRIASGGNVGIASTTPFLSLTVHSTGGQKDLGVFNGAICADNDGTTKCYAALTAGTVYGDASSFAASDVAENYPVYDDSIEAGDIVAMFSQASSAQAADKKKLHEGRSEAEVNELTTSALLNSAALVKASASNASRVIGVVSTAPGVLLGDTTGMTLDTKMKPVALVGRVPLKVSVENGPIEIGDHIALSSTPGVGAKATTSGTMVGIALEAFDGADAEGGIGKVLVFVNLGYSHLDDATPTLATSDMGQTTSNGWSVDQTSGKVNINFFGDINANGNKIINVAEVVSQHGLWRLDDTGQIIAKRVKTELLEVTEGVTFGTPERPVGITLYDRITKQPICVYAENGAMKSSEGTCASFETLQGESSSATVSAALQSATDNEETEVVVEAAAIATSTEETAEEAIPVVLESASSELVSPSAGE